jgi:hypothetical protein
MWRYERAGSVVGPAFFVPWPSCGVTATDWLEDRLEFVEIDLDESGAYAIGGEPAARDVAANSPRVDTPAI